MSTFNETGWSERETLRLLNDEVAFELLPAIIFVAVLMLSGIVGNAVVCYVFCFRLRMGTQHFLFVALAAFDLLTCFIAMPAQLANMRNYLMSYNNLVCRLLRFISVFTCISSSLTLVVIGLDRYLKICRPLGYQMSLRHSALALFPVILVSFILSIPTFVLSGIQTSDTDDLPVQASYCAIADTADSTFLLVRDIILFVIFMAIVLTLIVLYRCIWRAIKRHNSNTFRVRFHAASRDNEHTATITTTDTAVADTSSSSPSSVLPTNPSQSTPASPSPTAPSSPQSSASLSPSPPALAQPTSAGTSVKSRKSTVVAVSVSAVFFLSYLPYFILVGIEEFEPEVDCRYLRGARLLLFNIFMHFPFLNAVANPIIYSALNPAFRKECAKLNRRLCPIFCTPQERRTSQSSRSGSEPATNTTTD